MDKNATTALAAIGRANLALGEQWLELSAWALGPKPGLHRIATDEWLIDEALTETFPAGDPISPAVPPDPGDARRSSPPSMSSGNAT
jgi:hypothetical protein